MEQNINNRGSATIEMSFVMPVVLVVVINIVLTFVSLVNQSVIQGNTYVSIYSYPGTGSARHKLELSSAINEETAMDSSEVMISMDAEEDLEVKIISGGRAKNMSGTTYKTEIDRCTSRLRRWQLYGDVLWE